MAYFDINENLSETIKYRMFSFNRHIMGTTTELMDTEVRIRIVDRGRKYGGVIY